MSTLANYFKTRYITRLEELREDVRVVGNSGNLSDAEFADYLHKKFKQFHETTRMHMKNFAVQNVSHNMDDDKYLDFMKIDWLASYLSGTASTDEILTK